MKEKPLKTKWYQTELLLKGYLKCEIKSTYHRRLYNDDQISCVNAVELYGNLDNVVERVWIVKENVCGFSSLTSDLGSADFLIPFSK